MVLSSGRVLRFKSAVTEDQAMQQPPTQKVQGSAGKPKGPYLSQLLPPQDDDDDDEVEPDHVQTVTLGGDDQARPSTSKLVGVPVE